MANRTRKVILNNETILPGTPKRPFHLSTLSKVFIVLILILGLLLTVVGIFSRNGLTLINTGLYMYGAFIMVALLPIWGALALILKIKKRTTKLIVGAVVGSVFFTLIMLGFVLLNMFLTFTTPQHYSTITSDGHSIVVLQSLDYDETRMEARRAVRLAAADPETAEDYAVEDYGYMYYAYPKKLGLFFDTTADVEGELYTNYESESKLMIEWIDENTAWFYLDNPSDNEGGEWIIHY